jgi:hypothetical protein
VEACGAGDPRRGRLVDVGLAVVGPRMDQLGELLEAAVLHELERARVQGAQVGG